MTTLAVIENKISAVQKYLSILEEYKKYSREKIEDDTQIRGSLERYLYLAVQSVIDLAESVLAFKNLRKPSTTSETFHILNEEGFIELELAKKLVAMVGFRNIVAHDYEKINYDIVYDILHNRLTDIETFLSIASEIK